MLGDVQSSRFDVLLHADSPEPLHRPQTRERCGERERADGDEAECLHSDLVERTRVDESSAPSGEILCQSGNGEDARRKRPPHTGEAVHRDRTDRIVDADALDERNGDDGDRRRKEPDHDGGPRRDESGRRGDCYERGDDAVQHHRHVGLAQNEPRGADPTESTRRGGEIRRQRDVTEVPEVTTGDDGKGRAGIESEPAEPKDDRPEHGVRHVVTGNRICASVLPEFADARPEQDCAGQRGERALVVHDRRTREVLHSESEQPAPRVPDPVRRDGIDQREADAEREVDPQLRALRHRPPYDRERYTGEHDLEEIRARAGNRGEERERRLADSEHRADRREEAVHPDHAVTVSEGERETDCPVDDRADAEDEDVLAGDVSRVLHPRESRFEKCEARLHEHDEHGRDHDPDGVDSDEEIAGLHRASTISSSRVPVRLCVTLSSREVHTSPSPDSLPLRAESTIASTTAGASSSRTTNVSCAFGRKRDSNTRPRYSCVTPR